jgi:hypothetical protein
MDYDKINFINSKSIKALGIEAVVFLNELYNQYKILEEYELFQYNEWICFPTQYVIDSISISEYKQHKIIKKLIERNLIKKEFKGLPRKRYFQINFNEIENSKLFE